ncbi:DUF6290 family protein [Galliscardovia ingluviei]|uniref:DUF6290 family protein n=1 Tax=Galliscardovia ingluviei TaxID=1769422 RepID=UPI0035316968
MSATLKRCNRENHGAFLSHVLQCNICERRNNYDLFNTTHDRRKNLATSYAKIHDMTLAEAFKKALFERIEDELI